MNTPHIPPLTHVPHFLLQFFIPLPFNQKPSIKELEDINVTISLIANTYWNLMENAIPEDRAKFIKEGFKTPQVLAEKLYYVYLLICKVLNYFYLYESATLPIPAVFDDNTLNIEEELKRFPFTYYTYSWNEIQKITHKTEVTKTLKTFYVMKERSQLYVMFMLTANFYLLNWRILLPLSNNPDIILVMTLLTFMFGYFHSTWNIYVVKFLTGEIRNLFPVTINEKPKNASKSTSQS